MAANRNKRRRPVSAARRSQVRQHVPKMYTRRFVKIIVGVFLIVGISVLVTYFFYETIAPGIIPDNAEPSATVSVPFVVKNKSNLFTMQNVTITCHLDRSVFVDDIGSQLTTPSNPSQKPPIIAQRDEITLGPEARIYFTCDEVSALRNPGFQKQFNTFKSAAVRIKVTYHTWMLNRTYSSPRFYRSEATGFRWTSDSITN
jgi:hypothetical protein